MKESFSEEKTYQSKFAELQKDMESLRAQLNQKSSESTKLKTEIADLQSEFDSQKSVYE